jgi:iron-sulfur cluster repair protein YtfE (RIC family)
MQDNDRMLRDKNLIPLSRQHQHALALCVRINRAALTTPAELNAWQAEIEQHFQQEIQFHFAAEETHLFPAARCHPGLSPLVDELLLEHSQLRHDFAQAAVGALDRPGLRRFAETLSTHIRKEERQLFEGMQRQMTFQELLIIGALVDEALAAARQACIVPTEASLKTPKT